MLASRRNLELNRKKIPNNHDIYISYTKIRKTVIFGDIVNTWLGMD